MEAAVELDPIAANRERWAKRCGRVAHVDDWAPFPPQEAFLALGCFEGLYGGQAGGGKTDTLLVWLLAGVGRGGGRAYLGLLLRRTFPELEKTAIPRARELFPRLGGVERNGGKEWRFPDGETILLEHCEHDADVTRYQGAAFTRIAFDELTTFSEKIYLYLFSRIRSAAGLWCGVRASSNPGGVGHEWVRRRFLDWVSRKSLRPAMPGEVRYFVKRGDDDVEVPRGTRGALGRTFIPARLEDNPALSTTDPEYEMRLAQLPRLEYARLRLGDWDAAPAAKDYWNREKCGVLQACPVDVKARVRAWDFGATASPSSDATTGVRQSHTMGGRVVIEHVAHARLSPEGVEAMLERTAEADFLMDPRTIQVIPEDPGAAGKMVTAALQRLLARYPIKVLRPTGDKATRFRPVSGRQLAGFVDVVDDGTWDVEGYHAELEAFPSPGVHDDRVDATADGYAVCAATTFEVVKPPEPRVGSRFAMHASNEEQYARQFRGFGG